MCPGGSHLACRWVSAGWGAGPRRASRHCRKTREGLLRLDWESVLSRLAGRGLLDAAPEPGFVPWNVQHPLPARSALLAPFSSQPWDCRAAFLGLQGISHLSFFSPLPSPTSFPAGASPRTLTQPPPHHAGDPQPCCQRGRERAAASPCIQKEPSGGPGPSCHLRGIPAAVSRARGRHGEGGERGSSAPGGSQGQALGWVPGVGGSLDPHLCLLCPPSAPRGEGNHRLTQACPPAGSAPAGTEPGAEGHPRPGAHPPLPVPPRVLAGTRVLRR